MTPNIKSAEAVTEAQRYRIGAERRMHSRAFRAAVRVIQVRIAKMPIRCRHARPWIARPSPRLSGWAS